MRIILTVIICLAITTTTVAQKIHPKFRSENVLDRRLVDKEKGLYRVIINNGSVYYLDENYEDPNAKIKVTPVGFCGNNGYNKPSATLIRAKNKYRVSQNVYSSEPTSPIILDSIPNTELLFSNGYTSITLSEDIPYRQIQISDFLLKKGNLHSFYSQPDIWYDQVIYARSPLEVIVKKDGLYGLYKGAIKFTSIKKTYNELYIGGLPNGNIVYIDKEGNEFYPRKVK